MSGTPPTPSTSTRRFVVGIDGSADSQRALRWAAHLAGNDPAVRIEAVYVCDLPTVGGADWHYVLPNWQPLVSADKVAHKTVDDAFGGAPPEGVVVRVAKGHAVAELIAATAGAEVLFVGSRGLGTFSKLLLGSVGSQCVRHARCPVVVVHDTEPPVESTRATDTAAYVGAR